MTVYLDMDGVIADFFGGIERRFGANHWKSIQDREVKFRQLANTDFFYTLSDFRDVDPKGRKGGGASISQEIVRFVNEITNGDWGICSSPLRGDRNNSAYWKRRWLEDRKFAPPLVENMIFTSNKHKYAVCPLTRKANILVDDKPDNIKKWEQAGGIGIRFQANEDDLEEYLFVELEKAIERSRTS